MTAAAIAKASSAQPIVVGKPSRAALLAVADRLGVSTREVVLVGDDVNMDIALGRTGGARTILVRSGISGGIDLERLAAGRRPDEVVDGSRSCSTGSRRFCFRRFTSSSVGSGCRRRRS